MRLVALFALLVFSTSAMAHEDESYYEQARELYRLGPAQGPEIVRLLRLHIQANPADLPAIALLGITLFGLNQPAEALPVLDSAIDLSAAKSEIPPKIIMFKARTLYDLQRFDECRKVLETFRAFWQSDPELKKLYEWYYPRVATERKAH